MPHDTDTSTRGLLRGVLDDVRELFREEVALARSEVRQELGKAAAAGVQFGIAGVALWFSAMFLLVAAALGISAMLDWPAWAGFGIVAIVLAVGGLLMLMGARKTVRAVQPLPRTVHSLKENFR